MHSILWQSWQEHCGIQISYGLDPLLGPLANNGGSTLTHALLPGSPAIDAGDPAVCAAAPVNNLDHRGVARPQGSACDIGAVEADLIYTPPTFGRPSLRRKLH